MHAASCSPLTLHFLPRKMTERSGGGGGGGKKGEKGRRRGRRRREEIQTEGGREERKRRGGEEKRRGRPAPPPSPSISPLPLSLLFLLLSLGGETWWPAPFATSPASSCSPHQPGCCFFTGSERGRRLPNGACAEKGADSFFVVVSFLFKRKKKK